MLTHYHRASVHVLDLISVILDLKVWASTSFHANLPKRIRKRRPEANHVVITAGKCTTVTVFQTAHKLTLAGASNIRTSNWTYDSVARLLTKSEGGLGEPM